MRTRFYSFTTIALLFAVATPASAALWTGAAGDGNWGTAGNWDTNTAPSAATPVSFTSGSATFNPAGEFPRASDTSLTGASSLTITGKRIQNANGGPANFTVSDSATFTHSGQYFLVSQNNVGSFTQTGGTVTSSTERGFFLSDGAGSQGTFNLSGGVFNLSITDVNSNSYMAVGRNSGLDRFNVSGGSFNITATQLGRRVYFQRDSISTFSGGTSTFSNIQYFSIGRDSGGAGPALVKVNGGTVNVSGSTDAAHAFIVGGSAGTGRLELSSGSINITNNSFWIGDGLSGAVEQTGGSFSIQGDVVLGKVSDSSYTMSGGTLSAFSIQLGNGLNSAFNFTGGTIILPFDQLGLTESSWFHAAPGLVATYDGNLDQTILTYATASVPEPTAALLTLPALALLRRRR